jgi:hypothetical protein
MKINKIFSLTVALALMIGLGFGVSLQRKFPVRIVGVKGAITPFISQVKQTLQVQDQNIPEELQGNLRLFILAGQSNMSGRGVIDDFDFTDENVYVFGNDYHWKQAFEPVDDPTNQVDQVSLDLEAGFSPALIFAKKLAENHPVKYPTIGLIPCAKGASSIHEWRRSLDDNTLYGSCLKRVRAASPMGEVAGLLFFQGETDAIDPILFPEKTLLPETWAVEFEMFVEDWRRDLKNPNLPIVFAQIGDTTSPDRYINWEVVQIQQSSIQLQHVTMITTKGLPLMDDVHFTTESYQVIGERFAEAYIYLQNK